MKKLVMTVSALTLAATLSSCGSSTAAGSGAIPQASMSLDAPTFEEPATEEPLEESVEEEPLEQTSSCDAAREAILTGTAADIKKAFLALQKDRTAEATAREYARYYLVRDKNNKDLREMDIGIIQMSCSLSEEP